MEHRLINFFQKAFLLDEVDRTSWFATREKAMEDTFLIIESAPPRGTRFEKPALDDLKVRRGLSRKLAQEGRLGEARLLRMAERRAWGVVGVGFLVAVGTILFDILRFS